MMTVPTSPNYPDSGVGASQSLPVARRVSRVMLTLVEIIAACILVVEVLVLLVGVTARYGFDRPLLWSDEVASLLFLWLAMFGAVVAYGRGEHMRMTAIVGARSVQFRSVADTLGRVVGLAFLAIALMPAIHYTLHEALMVTAALEISMAWRVSALPVGITLMLVMGLLALASDRNWLRTLAVVVAVALVAAGLMALQPALVSMGRYNLIVFFVVLLGLAVLSGIPIAFSFGVSTLAYLALTSRLPLEILVGRMDEGMSNFILLSVPLFVLLGLFFELSGMARALVGFFVTLLGHTKAGLHYVLIIAIYVVSGISGSKTADMAAVAPALFPEMEKRGARKGDMVALLAATGAQSETIAPSLVLITIGSVTSVSIADLFKAGFAPALFLAVVLVALVAFRSRTSHVKDVAVIEAAGSEKADVKRRATGAEIRKAALIAVPSLFLPFLIRTVVVEGVATATEVSTIGIVYALVFGIINVAITGEKISFRRIWNALTETVSLSGAILFIIGCATATAWALTQSGFSSSLADMMANLPGGHWEFMAASIVLFVVMGSILEGIPAMVLFAPLLFPIATAVGIDKVHYAMVAVLSMGLGLFAPPFGVGFYTACAIGRVDPQEAVRPIIPYLIALFIGVVVLAIFPQITSAFL